MNTTIDQDYIILHVGSDLPELTPQLARSYLAEVVRERGPQYRYEWITDSTDPLWDGNECHYVRNGEPSCALGRLLAKHGVPTALMHEWEGQCVQAIMSYAGVRCSVGLAKALNIAQSAQDDQRTYSTMLAIFEEALDQEGL